MARCLGPLPAGRVDVAVDRRNVATGRRRYRVRAFVFERTVERGLTSAPQVVDSLRSMCLMPMVPPLVRVVSGVKPEAPLSVAILGVVKPLAPMLAETGCFWLKLRDGGATGCMRALRGAVSGVTGFNRGANGGDGGVAGFTRAQRGGVSGATGFSVCGYGAVGGAAGFVCGR